MALTAQEQALLDSLTKKATEPEPVNQYDSLASIVKYLVQVSDKFTANPEDRSAMLSVLDALITPATASADESN
jgi:hypothetical protein